MADDFSEILYTITVNRHSVLIMKCRTQFCFWDCTVALPQHTIPFRTKFVGDTTSDWERVTVSSLDGGYALITFLAGYPFELRAKFIGRTL